MRSAQRFAMIMVLVTASNAGATGVSVTTSDEQRLRELTVEWMSAAAQKDSRRLEEIMAPNYTLETPGALERVGRSEWLKNAVNKEWRNFRYENVSVAVEGTQAIVTSRLYFKVSPIPVTVDSGVVDVWIKRNNQWQIKTRYLAASDFFTKVAFVAGAISTAVLLGVAAIALRLLRKRRAA